MNLAAGAASQDRVAVLEIGDVLVAVLADGAGGMAGGAAAAEAIVDSVAAAAKTSMLDAAAWTENLATIDRNLARHFGGQSTVVVVAWRGDRLVGASVGDSEAWWFGDDGIALDLTIAQRSKPLVGSGFATPVPFIASVGNGRLLVASDGLFKYATAERIERAARTGTPALAADALAELSRLPAGGLPDDVSIIVAAARG